MRTLTFVGIIAVSVLLSLALAFLLTPLLPFPPLRIFNRCLLILGLTGAILFRKHFQKKSFVSLGLERRNLPLIPSGVAFALLSLLLLTWIAFHFHAALFEVHPPRFKKLFYYVMGAALTGFFEELFFRGFLFQALMEDTSTRLSVVLSSAIYSFVHFIPPLLLNKPEALSLFYTESIGLFFFGVLMAYAFLRTRSLYLSMGLHGGFILFLKMDGIFVNRLITTSEWLFGGERLIGGIATWLIFPIAFLWVRWISRGYLPIQNCEKILSSRSSVNTSPTISPRV